MSSKAGSSRVLARLLRPRAAPGDTAPAPIDVAGRKVPVVVSRNVRARRSIVRADAIAGTVRITLPARAPIDLASAMVVQHLDWIAGRVAEWPQPLAFVHGARIPFGDTVLTLDCDSARPPSVRRAGDLLLAGGPAETHRHRIERWLKAEALRSLGSATDELAAEIGRSVSKVGVRDPRGRWGSCTADGAISYSWRLILAPRWVQHSVVAHEVAHLVHPNHSAGFWKLAGVLNRGNPTAARRWLRKHGPALHWIGRAT